MIWYHYNILKEIILMKCTVNRMSGGFFVISLLLSTLTSNASNWTRSDGDYAYIPKFASLKTDDLTSFKVEITDKNPYATTGIFFKNGQVNPVNNTVIARTTKGTPVNIQFDEQNFYPNGSVRFALITIEKPADTDNEFEVILSSTLGDKPQTKITALKPQVKVIIKRSDFGEKSVTLSAAKSEVTPWRSGNLVDVRRYYAAVTADLMVEFDVTTFANGMVRSDVVMRYDRIYETPMTSIDYDMAILVNDKPYKALAKTHQNHHSKFRTPIRFGYSTENITALNMSRIMDTKALARYDITLGVAQDIINRDYGNFKNADNSRNGSSLINPHFPDTGTREDIALLPQWTARYVLTSDDKEREVVLGQSETSAYIPWHFIDSKTNQAPLPHNHPKLYLDYRATFQNNKIAPYGTEDTGWVLDIAHQPSLSYIPYMITGDRYYYDNLVAAYTWSRFSIINEGWGMLRNPVLRTQNFDQQRAYGWLQRLTAETALVVPDASPLRKHLTQQMAADVAYFQKGHIDGLEYEGGTKGNPTGELFGMLHGFGSDTGRENPLFMQNLATIGIGFQANSGVNNAMKTISAFQTNFISGIFLQKNNGYPPEFGAAYKIMQYIPDEKNGIGTMMGKIRILSRWQDVFKYSVDTGYFNDSIEDVKAGKLPGFVDYSRAAQAILYNTTQDPRSLEAYGFLAQYLPEVINDYHYNPAYAIVPEIGKGYLTYRRTFIGDDDNDTMVAESSYNLIHGRDGNDTLSLGEFSGVALGGNGNDTLKAGKHDGFLFGGSGVDILISGSQDDYLKGDENYGKEKDIFIFNALDFGKDTIEDFTVGIDKIQLTPKTGITTYYHDNKVYGSTSDKRNNTDLYRQVIQPEIPSGLSEEERQKYTDKLLSEAENGNAESLKKLNVTAQVNIGVENYLHSDGNGGTYIDFNINRTPAEKAKIQQDPAFEPFGIIHLLNVPKEKLKSDDFIFENISQ